MFVYGVTVPLSLLSSLSLLVVVVSRYGPPPYSVQDPGDWIVEDACSIPQTFEVWDKIFGDMASSGGLAVYVPLALLARAGSTFGRHSRPSK